ncbi:hypothetical protein ZIOFF_043035 [Zingiber officinale]|uniref:HAT C-terminal dimerisation domain-containing protein n=1 Tax=Zingiber officinale TaxID=94328 RepID=A0A8J5FWN4_ZINOF|nr:hypothetical protein ZIOFF_043035 [Zingiber officinale]
MAYESQTITSAGKTQLDLYLEEPTLEFAYYQDLNVLEHWKNQNHRYPTLALMTCDVLAIPITTVASESAFSIGSHVLTKYRSCTLHEKVQALICTRNWLHGYAIASASNFPPFATSTVCAYFGVHPDYLHSILIYEQATIQEVNLLASAYWVPEDKLDYLNYGAAISEVEVDIHTGATTILRIDLTYDCGQSLNPAVDLGQIEGAFVQGIGFFLY